MTAICYSQLSGFRSPWGGAGGRCWQEAGWFTGPPPPPLRRQHRAGRGLCMFPPSVPFLFALHPSLLSFSLDTMSILLSPLISTFAFNPPNSPSLLYSSLFKGTFAKCGSCCTYWIKLKYKCEWKKQKGKERGGNAIYTSLMKPIRELEKYVSYGLIFAQEHMKMIRNLLSNFALHRPFVEIFVFKSLWTFLLLTCHKYAHISLRNL